MTTLVHDLIHHTAQRIPDRTAVSDQKAQELSYTQLSSDLRKVAGALRHYGLQRNDRVGIYLPKTLEIVQSIFGTTQAGGIFVPINPLLKPAQLKYIARDCNIRILITQAQRLNLLEPELRECPDLHTIITLGKQDTQSVGHIRVVDWETFLSNAQPFSERFQQPTDDDLAAILYTSGSTGNPKGVVLSHRNMVVGAESVSEYLLNTEEDRILAVLPFSFDYGLSQLTTAFKVGARCYLMDYLLPNDIIKAVQKFSITGLAAVPPLWSQLCKLNWAEGAGDSLRYFTNSGGAMPEATLKSLRNHFRNAKPYLMYGLTEAFRSSYLPPDQVDTRPTSMGKAIPNAELLVVREDGSECAPHEPGELVHLGPLVSLGYWNAEEKTNERFKPAPGALPQIKTPQLAVWSGDTVYKDEEGYLFFVARKDDMIKTSGYRVSPTEVEEALYSSGLVVEVAAVGVPHSTLGQAIICVLTPTKKPVDALSQIALDSDLSKYCKQTLPNFMVPQKFIIADALPHNANGKIDRKQLSADYKKLFDQLDAH